MTTAPLKINLKEHVQAQLLTESVAFEAPLPPFPSEAGLGELETRLTLTALANPEENELTELRYGLVQAT